MASILRVNTLTDASSNNSTAMSTINQGTAKSWCRWESVGSVSVGDSFNHASITDNATGDQSLTVTNAFANVQYAHSGTAGLGAQSLINISQQQDVFNATTTAARYETTYVNGTAYDCSSINISLHGDLA